MINMVESPLTKIGRFAGTLERYSKDGARILMEPVESGTPDYDNNVREIYGAAERSAGIANAGVNRRVAAPLIVLGLAGIGYCVYNSLYGKKPEPGVTTISTTSELSKTSSTKQETIAGRLCFDYNGNGKQDGEEPPVQKAKVRIVDPVSLITDPAQPKIIQQVETDSSGDYHVDIPAGNYKLFIEPDNPKFRYMCTSPAEFKSIIDGYDLTVAGPRSFDIGLMEGFLTLPFPKGIPIYVDPVKGDYFDHDPGPNSLWWDGTTHPAPRWHTPEYAHPETDFVMPKGTEVKVAAAGRVNSIETESNGNGLQWISLTHLDGYGTTYLHIGETKVPVGAYVNRGDTIALSSNTGTGSTDDFHTAFQIWRHMPDGHDYCIDPYSPVAGVPKGAWIAGIWKWYPSNDEWISQGYWTEFNNPHYSLASK